MLRIVLREKLSIPTHESQKVTWFCLLLKHCLKRTVKSRLHELSSLKYCLQTKCYLGYQEGKNNEFFENPPDARY